MQFARRWVALGVIGLFCIGLTVEYSQNDESKLAKSLKSVGREAKVSDLLPGDWDFACVISETERPEAVVSQVSQQSLTFETTSNTERRILLDGESGLVVISKKRGTYSLYLAFDANRVAVIHSRGPQCFPFTRARLVEKLKLEEWRYFELVDEGND